MKFVVSPANLQVTGHLGPVCISCGNTRVFWMDSPDGEQHVAMAQLPEGEVRITACGRCRSRNSIVVTRIDAY